MDSLKYAEAERRNEELETYGKLVSLRPSIIMKNKKKYNRKQLKQYVSKLINDYPDSGIYS